MTTVCSNCGEPTEWDEAMGPAAFCVECWDLKVEPPYRVVNSRSNLLRNRSIRERCAAGIPKVQVAREFGLAKRTVFRVLGKASA
jgi:hypothetical protein